VKGSELPYYAVNFTSLKRESAIGYNEMAEAMIDMAATQPGFMGVESVREADGRGITVSCWESEQAIQAWKANVDHVAAQKKGREQCYASYRVRVCKIEREYGT